MLSLLYGHEKDKVCFLMHGVGTGKTITSLSIALKYLNSEHKNNDAESNNNDDSVTVENAESNNNDGSVTKDKKCRDPKKIRDMDLLQQKDCCTSHDGKEWTPDKNIDGDDDCNYSLRCDEWQPVGLGTIGVKARQAKCKLLQNKTKSNNNDDNSDGNDATALESNNNDVNSDGNDNKALIILIIEAINVIQRENLCNNAEKLGHFFREYLLANNKSIHVKSIHGIGLLNAIDFHSQEKADEFVEQLINNHIFAKTTREATVRITPPLVISLKQMSKLVKKIVKVLDDL